MPPNFYLASSALGSLVMVYLSACSLVVDCLGGFANNWVGWNFSCFGIWSAGSVEWPSLGNSIAVHNGLTFLLFIVNGSTFKASSLVGQISLCLAWGDAHVACYSSKCWLRLAIFNSLFFSIGLFFGRLTIISSCVGWIFLDIALAWVVPMWPILCLSIDQV